MLRQTNRPANAQVPLVTLGGPDSRGLWHSIYCLCEGCLWFDTYYIGFATDGPEFGRTLFEKEED